MGSSRAPDAARAAGSPTRKRLLDAGLGILDEQPLPKVFAGVSTAAVAERAGVTTGSFFHHFANASEFVDAIVLSFADVPSSVGRTVEEIDELMSGLDLGRSMTGDLNQTWLVFQSDERIRARFRAQMQLWAHHHKELSTPQGDVRTAGDVLRMNYQTRQDESTQVWQLLLDRTGRKLLPPFTLERLATALTSLFQGLVIRAAVDGERVDDQMFADVVTVIAASVTVPRDSALQLADLRLPFRAEEEDRSLSPQARSGARRRRESRQRITAASAHLFGSGWESVSAGEVADAAGVSHQTVINLFPSVRTVAATTFARHMPSLHEAAGPPDGQREDPRPGLQRLEETLTQLGRCVDSDTEAARALLSERLETFVRHADRFAEYDIRQAVPLAEPLLVALSRLDLGDAEPLDVVRTLIDFVISQNLGRPNRATETAQLAMRLLPPSAAPATS